VNPDDPPRAEVTRHDTRWPFWRYSVSVRAYLIEYRREDGGPYAMTRNRAEAKARRLLRTYTRPSRDTTWTVEP
jgi:hypothetical protein